MRCLEYYTVLMSGDGELKLFVVMQEAAAGPWQLEEVQRHPRQLTDSVLKQLSSAHSFNESCCVCLVSSY